MPNRKQRRRREKLKRHEYEYVVETDEGQEVPLERASVRGKDARRNGRAREPVDRRGRAVPKPSFRRVMKRTAIFGPLLLAVMFFTAPQLSLTAKIFNALVLLAFFIPFSYMVDMLVYRVMVRRHRRQLSR